jgi:hypothetical protein
MENLLLFFLTATAEVSINLPDLSLIFITKSPPGKNNGLSLF